MLNALSVKFPTESKSRPGTPGISLEGHLLAGCASSPPPTLLFAVYRPFSNPVEAFVRFTGSSFVSAFCWDLVIRVRKLTT